MNSLVAKIDNELHSTRFLRNENPPETHPLLFLPGSPRRSARRARASNDPDAPGRMRRSSITPRWSEPRTFDVIIRNEKEDGHE